MTSKLEIMKSIFNIHNLPRILLVTLSVVLFGWLFLQTFAGADYIDLVTHRDENDATFHGTLRILHSNLHHFSSFENLVCNANSYGWLFWFLITLVTYPFYLLSLSGSDTLLIAVPSQVSLLLTFTGVYFLYKTLSVYTANEWIKLASLTLLYCFSCFGYLSIQFHPTAFNFCLNALVLYWVVSLEKGSRKDVVKIALVFGLSVGTKLNAILFAPVLFLLLADRTGWRLNRENLIKASIFLVVFLGSVVIAMNPLLLSFNAAIWAKFAQAFAPSLEALTNVHYVPEYEDHAYMFREIVLGGYLGFGLTALCLVFFLMKTFQDFPKKQPKNLDMAFYLVGFLIVAVYITFRVRYPPMYAIPYLFPVALVLPLSFCFLEKLRKPVLCVLFLTVPLLTLASHALDKLVLEKVWGKEFLTPMEYRYIANRVDRFSDQRGFALRLRENLKPFLYKDPQTFILWDENLPMPFRENFHEGQKIRFVSFGNEPERVSDLGKNIPHYICLYKQGRYLWPKEKLNDYYEQQLQNASMVSLRRGIDLSEQVLLRKERGFKIKNFLDGFFQTKKIMGKKYKLLEETSDTMTFVLDDTIQS